MNRLPEALDLVFSRVTVGRAHQLVCMSPVSSTSALAKSSKSAQNLVQTGLILREKIEKLRYLIDTLIIAD